MIFSRAKSLVPIAMAMAVAALQVVAPVGRAQAAAAERPCAEARADSGGVAQVVAAARAFASTLDPQKRASLVHPFERKYAIRWSNFPSALVPRNGVAFGELDATQLAAARALVLAAAGACGATLFDENRAADVVGNKTLAYLGPAFHFISFNGTPSEDKPWMLMISGHHLDYNIVFKDGVSNPTPLFAGSDPAVFIDDAGKEHRPMKRQAESFTALTLAVANYPAAHLDGVFTDLTKSVVNFGDPLAPPMSGGPPPGGRPGGPGGPGGQGGARGPFGNGGPGMTMSMDSKFGIDEHFPQSYERDAARRGVAYAALKPAEQALVRQVIEAYGSLAGVKASAPLLREYLAPKALAATYVAYSGDPSLGTEKAYARIDGPRVWIELSVQPSLYDKSVVHYHSLWRDKLSDYGGQFRE